MGNPGKGSVIISTGIILLSLISRVIDWSLEIICAPAFLRFKRIASILFESILLIVIFPFVKAAAIRYVPASILSAGILKVVPFSLFTPLILISSVPAPIMFAPIEFKKSARSEISGSLATLLSIVSPSAREAAIIRFSVPVTVIPSNLIFAPISPFDLASIYPFFRLISAPSFLSAFR